MKLLRPVVLAGAVLLAVLCVLAGAYSESTFLVLLGVAGVPTIILGAVALHYVNSVQRAGELNTMQRSFVEGAALRIERDLSAALSAARQANLAPSELDRFLEDARTALAPQASLHVEGEAVQVVLSEGPVAGSWARRAEQAVSAASRDAAGRIAPALELKMKDFGANATMLPRESVIATCEAYVSHFAGASTVVSDKFAAVERAIADVEAELDVEEAWEHVRSAKRLWKNGETEFALKALGDAEAIVYEHLRPAFESRRAAILGAIDELQRMDVSVVAGATTLDQLARLQKDVSRRDLKTAGLPALEADERKFAQILQTITSDSRSKVGRVKKVLGDYPGLVDMDSLEDLVRQLDETPTIEHPYQQQFPMWIESMRSALARMSRYESATKVVGVMPKMEPIVARNLKEKGSVRPSDLPVREHGEVILELYSKRHPEVTFENGVLRPVRQGSAELA